MPWPTLDQYQHAVQHPEHLLRHPLLKKGKVDRLEVDEVEINKDGCWRAGIRYQVSGTSSCL